MGIGVVLDMQVADHILVGRLNLLCRTTKPILLMYSLIPRSSSLTAPWTGSVLGCGSGWPSLVKVPPHTGDFRLESWDREGNIRGH